jgi:hypothetical protein
MAGDVIFEEACLEQLRLEKVIPVEAQTTAYGQGSNTYDAS